MEGIDENNKTFYKITPKGKKLLRGWISFLHIKIIINTKKWMIVTIFIVIKTTISIHYCK